MAFRTVSTGAGSRDVAALAVDGARRRLALGSTRGVWAGDVRGVHRRLLRRGPVRDLAWLPDPASPPGALLVATGDGVFRVEASGRVEALSPGPGASARSALRVAVVPGAAALATEAGLFVSRDARRWQRLASGLPSPPATAVALRERGGVLECWAVLGGQLWLARLRAAGAGFEVLGAARQTLAFAARDGGPVDVALDLPGLDVAVLFPRALALRRGPDGGWQEVRPTLPPGASIVRIAAALDHWWLATDRGLMRAPAATGPWHRAAPPAGSAAVRALAAGADALFAASEVGLLAAAPAAAPREAAAPAGVRDPEPSIQQVHRAAIEYLDLTRERVRGWRRGLARRGWLPEVVLRGAHGRDSFHRSQYDQVFSTGAVRDLVDRDRDRNEDYEVILTLSWELGDLAYNPEEIDVSREARERIELRDDVLDEITQLYFERRRVLAELAALGDEPGGEGDALRRRADELAAGIDAWTGGWFSRHTLEPALR